GVGGTGGRNGDVAGRGTVADRGRSDGGDARVPLESGLDPLLAGGGLPGGRQLDDRFFVLFVAAQGGLGGPCIHLCLHQSLSGGGVGLGAGGRDGDGAHAGRDRHAARRGGADRARAEQASGSAAGGRGGVAGRGGELAARLGSRGRRAPAGADLDHLPRGGGVGVQAARVHVLAQFGGRGGFAVHEVNL